MDIQALLTGQPIIIVLLSITVKLLWSELAKERDERIKSLMLLIEVKSKVVNDYSNFTHLFQRLTEAVTDAVKGDKP